jgi:hypothetical protein
MKDVVFVDKESTHVEPLIIIRTTCSAYEDLLALIMRIKGGNTPCTRELLAILEDIHHLMQQGYY